MPVVDLSVSLKIDGQDVDGFPVVRRSVVAQSIAYALTRTPDGNTTTFTALPLTSLGTCTFFVFHCDQAVYLRMGDQGDAAGRPVIPLSAGGLLLFVDGGITESGTNPGTIRANVPGASVAHLTGIGAGT